MRNGTIRHNKAKELALGEPRCIVKKKSGETRFCVDYRKLNGVTVKNSWSGSNIEDILTYLRNAKYFSSLDMYSGYWQVKVKEESKLYSSRSRAMGI